MTDQIEDDGFITVHPPIHAAATHAPGVATTDLPIPARAVVAEDVAHRCNIDQMEADE